jgi:hypothetical protein
MSVHEHEDGMIRTPDDKYTFEQMNMLIHAQRLWIQFASWMRTFMLNTLENSNCLPAVTTRLYEQIPLDLYNVFLVFYGEEIAQQFLNLFSRFIHNTWPMLEAYKSGDQEAINASAVQWYRTADDLATFLAKNNIYWNEDQWKSLLYQYIRSYIQEIIAYLGGDYEQEIAIYENLEDISSRMAGYMARGIIARNLALAV